MIQIMFQFDSIASAAALMAQLNGQQVAAIVPPIGVSAAEKAAVLRANEAAMADTVEAPGKPQASAASTKTQSPASPTTPSADAPSASPAYADLQKVVLQLHAIDAAAPLQIAKALGFDNFKPLKEPENADKIPAAHAAVLAKIAELKAA